MKLLKKIVLWFLAVPFAITAFGVIPNLASIPLILIALLIVPIERVQDFVHKFLKGKIKVAAIVVLMILAGLALPKSDVPLDLAEPTQTVALTAQPTVQPTVEPTPTPIPTPTPTPEPTAAPTAEPTSKPTVKPTQTAKPTHTHSFSAATCTSPKTCTTCGATEGAAKGHKWKAATPSAPKTCTVCGATQGSALDIPGKENYHGHVYTGGESSKKYHYEADCAGKYSHEITWGEVQSRGLDPCGTCVLK